MKEQDKPPEEEKKILIYLLGTSISLIALIGGFLVFILLLIDIDMQILAGLFSSYLALAISILMTFHQELLQKFGLRKYFDILGIFFLLIAIALFSEHFLT
ncbi:hypothetical protein AKJ56_02105 [candidate division MSBL1 archaeon SCGC-AAA382N08]|uniref:Major facilitator superfamily (MFS) profile domain-containing protein n=1 Tax=candidate division MSBL1 archaeon SCGC-AAA382N08 TaxID=1698285 RepID=A0A133VNB0_9EURY|nr:hypothetical protein AKJ56_02105 [candidate division MSBL1 archaeon SCGC-AAA382N08]